MEQSLLKIDRQNLKTSKEQQVLNKFERQGKSFLV